MTGQGPVLQKAGAKNRGPAVASAGLFAFDSGIASIPGGPPMSLSRRTFLKGAAAAAAFGVPAANVLGAHEKFRLGLIGSGGRGRALITEALKQGHACVALCDVAEFRM